MLKAKKGSLGDLAWEHTVNGNSFSDVPSRFDSAQIKDIIFERDENLYKKAIRFWEVCVDKQELLPNEKKEDFNSFYKPQYYLDKYGTKEVYAKTESILCPWAMVSPDGEWYEQGNMGFWGINDASKNSTISFISIFEKTLKDTNPENFITILDCHI